VTERTTRFRMLALTLGALSTLAAGCAAVPTAEVSLDDVVDERLDRLESRVDVLLESHASYLRSRWPDLALPQHEVEAWLEPGQWQLVFARCLYQESGDSDGARDLDVATYSCEARFPPPSLATNRPGPVEIAWVTEYARTVLPSCLRRSGVMAPPVPQESLVVLEGGATPEWDPYAVARGDAAERARLEALCPHPSTLLAQLPLLPSDAALTGVP